MTRYTYAQLEEIWVQAGGHRAMAPLMAAIAEVESGGNPDAENPSGATGLWQMEWPLYANFVPGATSRLAYHNPLINARAAVKLSRNNPSVAPGSPVYDNWIKWEFPAGAYRSHMQGGVAPSGPVPAATGTTGTAQLTSFNLGDIADPLTAINDLWRAVSSPVTQGVDIATSVTAIAQAFRAVTGVGASILKDIEWLFVPSHWMRIMAGIGGAAFLVPGVRALMQAGSNQGGDVTLSMGILLTMIAGILLFVAFHNLPSDVRSFPDLLGFISEGVRTQQAPAA